MDYNKLKGMSVDEAFEYAGEFSTAGSDLLRKVWQKESSSGANMGPSKAGAEGHFQQMPATKAAWDKRFGMNLDPYDFHDGLFMAAHQLKENLGIAKGDIGDALRMYNSGMDRSKWDNPETNDYVATILGAEAAKGSVRDVIESVDMLTARGADVRAETRKLKEDGSSKELFTPIEKALIHQTGAIAASAGMDTEGVIEARERARGSLPQITDAMAVPVSANEDRQAADAMFAAEQERVINLQKEREAVTFADKVSAAALKMDTVRIYQSLVNSTPPAEPGFSNKYMENIDEIEKGYTREEIAELREARSSAELDAIRDQIAKDRELSKTLYGNGLAGGLMTQLALGLFDPAGWAAGLGIGKAMQVGRIGSRVLAAEGRTGAAVASLAGEAAAGNVLIEAALDASGNTVTLNDYALSATIGLAFGTAVSPLALRKSQQAYTQAEIQQIQSNALQAEAELLKRAQERTGPAGTPDQIQRAMEEIQKEDIESLLRISLAPVENGSHFLGPVDDTGVVKPIATEADVQRLGLDTAVSDPTQRIILADMIVRAERFAANNPIDPAARSTVLKLTGQESTGQVLMMSESPVAQMFAQTILENSVGSGGRRRTAALSSTLRYQHHVAPTLFNYEQAYKLYRNEYGGGAVGDMLNGRLRADFDRAVAIEREARRSGSFVREPHPAVKQAADDLDRAYTALRIEQQHVGTVGASRLGTDSVGYMPHQMSPARVMNLSQAERKAVVDMMSKQFQDRLEFDPEFSDRLAVKYLERMRERAKGQHQVPVNLTNPYAADMVRDALKALGVGEEDFSKVMGRFSRGGAAHTKQRLDLDLNMVYTKDDGSEGRLIDLFITDQMDLFKSYARRTSSEVALAQYGIMGKSGLDLLRSAIDVTGGTPKDLKAFDQTVAEFLNQPFGTAHPTWMDNTIVLTSLSRLGGMGFTQMGEYANGIGALGVMGVAKSIKALPQMLKAIRSVKKGEKLNDPIIDSIDLIGGSEIGMDGYQVIGVYDIADNAVETYGRESLGAFTRMVRAGGNTLSRFSMHRAIQTAQTRGMAQQIVHKSMRFIRAGKEDKALDDMGITASVRQAIKAELPAIAEFDHRGQLLSLDLTKMQDTVAANAFVQAVHRGSSQIIQRTYIGETGPWAHNAFLKMLTQFRTFPIVAIEKQWNRQMTAYGAKAFGVLLGSMAFALPIHMARIHLSSLGMSSKEREEYIDRRTTPFALSQALFNYTSTSGLLSDGIAFGTSALDTVTGGQLADTIGSPRGGAARSGIVEQVVPSVGFVNDLFSGSVHKTLKALPFGNTPQIAPFINILSGK